MTASLMNNPWSAITDFWHAMNAEAEAGRMARCTATAFTCAAALQMSTLTGPESPHTLPLSKLARQLAAETDPSRARAAHAEWLSTAHIEERPDGVTVVHAFPPKPSDTDQSHDDDSDSPAE